MSEIVFTVNGVEYKVNSSTVPFDTTLNTYIRDYIQLKGTKFMCLEGGCGACTVNITGTHPVTKHIKSYAVNSCMMSIFSCDGLNIKTVEGVGDKEKYDQTQTRLVLGNGIQCGYCSPGMVMNMYSLMQSKNGKQTMEDVENSFDGNLCRCTGYRPILDAFKSLAVDADPKLFDFCKDIEDLKSCKRTGPRCREQCKSKFLIPDLNLKKSLFFHANREWHKVYELKEIFEIFSKIGNRTYMLVSGNTAHGVYRRKPNIEVLIDVVDVKELRTYQTGIEIEIGGNMTLTETIDIFNEIGTKHKDYEYLNEVNKHLKLIANIATRNIGTIAGNLMIKNQHPEFQSDLYLILDVLDARLTICGIGEEIFQISMIDFLQLDMKNKIIVKITIPPYSPKTYVYRSFKIMPRAQNSPAYVNAAFLFELHEYRSVVKSARIGYGGISSTFTRASETELYLIGKKLFSNIVLKTSLEKLSKEISPDLRLSNSSVEYRKNLALSLFYKFVLSIILNDTVQSCYQSGGSFLERGLSSGIQSYHTQPERYPLSSAIPRVDGFVQAGGETTYTNDLPRQPNELWAAIVHATKVHGTITGFDADAALNIEGVFAFYSSKDLPHGNSFTFGKFDCIDEELLCSGKVLYHGQPAGIILAETASIAEQAAALVIIQYTKESAELILPTMKDVFNANATEKIERRSNFDLTPISFGTDSQIHLKGNFEVGSQYHFFLEPQTCIVTPTEDGLNVHSSTQWLSMIQSVVSKLTNIQECRLNVETRRLGGGFGGKQSRSSFAACIAAVSCVLSKRPIRLIMTMESTMKSLGKRYPCYSEYNVDVNSLGKIQKLENTFYSDQGINISDNVDFLIANWIRNCYDCGTWSVRANDVFTHSPSNTYVRGPGTCEGIAMIEDIMEHIAYVTGQDPISVRLQNIPDDNTIRQIIPGFLSSTDYYQRNTQIEKYNAINRWKKRGIAITTIQYPQNFFGHFPALVSVHHMDGTVSISHGGIEIGQGVLTKACQVAAFTLKIPIENVCIKPTTNLVGGNAAVSGGSTVTDSVCFAVLKACEELNRRIKPVRDEFPDATWENLIFICNERHINLSALYLENHTELENHYVHGLACCEVEVDILTGNFNLSRVDILEDVGNSISPLMDVGQIEGGFVMGIGFWLSEKLIFAPDGELLTNRTWNYNPPGAKDIPIDFRISFLKDPPNKINIFSAKVVGEPPTCLSVVVVFALRNALISARKDAGMKEPWMTLKAPYTVENVFLSAGNDIKAYKL